MKRRTRPLGDRLIVVGPLPPPWHGVAATTDNLLRALAAEGALAAHLNTAAPSRSVHRLGRFDLANVRRALGHLVGLVRLLAAHRDAAVYLPISQNRLGFLRDAVLLLAARVAARRRYVHLHGGHFAEFYAGADPVTRVLVRAALRDCYQAWVLTDGLVHMFDGLVPRSRVFVVENTVPSLNGTGSRERPTQPGPLRVLFLSNLFPGKGVFDLLAALEALGERARGFEVHIVGAGELATERRIDAAARALAQHGIRVRRLGFLAGEDKLRELEWAEALVLPTFYVFEGQPLVLLEAMAAGLPIVTTRHAGIPDTVRDGREALLIDPHDVPSLSHALERLANDPGLRHSLGRAGYARWRERYAPERFDEDLLRLLAEAPAGRDVA